jgi:hypothetical protein
MRQLDLIGQRFSRLVVLAHSKTTRSNSVPAKVLKFWLCQCDCGLKTEVCTSRLRTGNTRSCGCLHREAAAAKAKAMATHGKSNCPTYLSWKSMKERCLNRKLKCYQNYGARGIKICERWMTFSNFLKDMGERPVGTTLDRKNTNGNYEPGNCRWLTKRGQSNNRRDNIVLSYGGITATATEWARRAGLKPSCILSRLKNGWSAEDAITRRHRLAKSTPTLNLNLPEDTNASA